MKNFKHILVIAALFTIEYTNTRTGISSPTNPYSRAAVPPRIPQPTSRPAIAPAPKLNAFTCISASVLPVYTKNNQKFVILTREARGNPQAQGGKRFTYDDFSGQCEEEDKYDALLSASREWYEEGNLKGSLNWRLEDAIKFVKDNTSEIVVYEKDIDPNIPGSRKIKNFTYIVNFDKYADDLLNNFYPALNKEKERYKKLGKNPEKQVTTEKDKIAVVLWDDLEGAISYQRIISGAQPVKVRALVKDEKTKKFHKEQIVLRPFLAIKLRSFFLHEPFATSAQDRRVKYYQH